MIQKNFTSPEYIFSMTFYDIFVYGTLRRGGMYAHYLAHSELIKERYVLPGYALYDYQQWYPYLVERSDSSVVGDIYQVSESALPALHELEGVDEQLYKFIYLPDHECYTYLKYDEDVSGLTYIEEGDWLSYQQSFTSKD